MPAHIWKSKDSSERLDMNDDGLVVHTREDRGVRGGGWIDRSYTVLEAKRLWPELVTKIDEARTLVAPWLST